MRHRFISVTTALCLAMSASVINGRSRGQSWTSTHANQAKQVARRNSPRMAAPTGKPELRIQLGHRNWVTSVSFSPDGHTLASGSVDETIKLWDVESGRERVTLQSKSDQVSSVAFSPDGQTLASGNWDRTITLWDVSTGLERASLQGHGDRVTSVAFSPDGQTLASGSLDTTIKLWDVKSGHERASLEGHSEWVTAIAFSPDGRTLASGGKDNTIKLWDLASRRERAMLTEHGDDVWSVAFSPDGRKLASGSYYAIKLWDVESGREQVSLPGHGGHVAFSPDGQTLAAGGDDKTIKLWDVETGRERTSLQGHSGSVVTVAFSPDGRTLASGSHDKTIKLWDMENGRERVSLQGGQSDYLTSVAFSPDGRTLASGSRDKTIKIWDVESGRERASLQGHTGPVNSITFSPDGQTLASAGFDQTIKLWDVETASERVSLRGHIGPVNSLSFSPDGGTLASGGEDGTVKLWDVASGREQTTLKGHTLPLISVAFSPDGRTLASGSWDKTIKLWDVETGRERTSLQGHTDNVISVVFSPDGRMLASGSGDATIKLWDVESGRERVSLQGHGRSVDSVCFSPDGRTLASGSWDNTIKLWDVESGRELASLQGHSDWVTSVVFSHDGKRLLSGDAAGTMKLWALEPAVATPRRTTARAREICMLVAFDDGTWAVVEPDNRFDTNNLEEIKGIHWVMPGEKFRVMPIEIFMRDYFEPGLLTRLLAGEKLRDVPNLSKLNRTQPLVKITEINPQASSPENPTGAVSVTVQVSNAKSEFQKDAKGNFLESGVEDLRLFRDGQLVGYAPSQDGAVKLENGRATVAFKDIHLPHRPDLKEVEFSAYAFNVARVKSATDRKVYEIKQPLLTDKPRAYVISVGVNAYENSSWNLRFAANDARRLQEVVTDDLRKQDNYDVVQVALLSDHKEDSTEVTEKTATRANFQTVLDLLAGHAVDESRRAVIPNGQLLKKARPEDLVLISFSSHGLADQQGNYYLLPYDVGANAGHTATSGLLARAISSQDLSLWLRDIDAGEMVMVIDACQSAATVGNEFKPGPMGSRGLGQLAYDKGMRLLVASQADDVAMESKQLKQGLLTYALVRDGLLAGQADIDKPSDRQITLGEWLRYAVDRVPHLYEEVKSNHVQDFGYGSEKGMILVVGGDRSSLKKKYAFQQPSLFDFTHRKRDVVLLRLSQGQASKP